MIYRKIINLMVAVLLLFSFSILGKAQNTGNRRSVKISTAGLEEGYVSTDDGTRLFYQKLGKSKKVIILPGRLFAFDEFKQLADGWTLISYDMRGRGRSDAIPEDKKSRLLGIHQDVKDVERIRRHFGAEKFSLIGYSYLGLLAVMYAMDYPARVERIVQIGPVPLKYGTKYPENLTNTDKLEDIGAGKEEVANLGKLSGEGYDKTNPRDFCEKSWLVYRFRLVGNPANVDKLGKSQCAMPNEYPVNLAKHFEYSFASVQKLDIPKEKVREVKIPVLTIHGTKDRNAPYGAGREWALLLPNARLLTVENAAHQVFAEYPEIVFPALRTFLSGSFPEKSEQVRELNPEPSEKDAENQKSVSVLPFPKGKASKLIQGNNGKYEHTGHAGFVFDFIMPAGSDVPAARSGEVVKIEEPYEDGTRKPGEENFVIIKHDDGTFARYYHLTKNGVLVSVGDKVEQGTKIALSGNSGASAGPHLHFEVTSACFDWGCQTVRINFTNAKDNPLKEGEFYEPVS